MRRSTAKPIDDHRTGYASVPNSRKRRIAILQAIASNTQEIRNQRTTCHYRPTTMPSIETPGVPPGG
ncbi:hypothetical protein [Neorhodopirellula lusitana]|uniref:hypothetical protein n=1 Tax=Neorhodopirellula lusitana TaxID=445327 RepID=UPI00384E9F19